MRTLNPKIIDKLVSDLGVAKQTIKNNVTSLAKKYPSATPNALAHLYALKKGKSVKRLLDKEDKQSFPQIVTPTIPKDISVQKSLKVIQIGKNPDSFYNKWWVQLLVAFFVVGILAGTIAQVLGVYIAVRLEITN